MGSGFPWTSTGANRRKRFSTNTYRMLILFLQKSPETSESLRENVIWESCTPAPSYYSWSPSKAPRPAGNAQIAALPPLRLRPELDHATIYIYIYIYIYILVTLLSYGLIVYNNISEYAILYDYNILYIISS